MHSSSQCPGWTSCLFLLYIHWWLFWPSHVRPENTTKRSEKKPSIKRTFLLNGERELSHDRDHVEQAERETLTQNSPHEFLTIQYSVKLSVTPQPATDTMWLGKDRGWNSENRPPEYSSKPLVAIRAQLKDRAKGIGSPWPSPSASTDALLNSSQC